MEMVPQIVLGIYIVVLIGISIVGFLRSKTTEEDYYLAGRNQGIIVTALTIMATFFSSSAMLGIPGNVYKEGFAFVLFALNVPVAGAAIYLLGSRISRIGRKNGYVTPGDMLADYYGGSAGVRLLVSLLGFLYVLPYVIMQIRAGGYLAQRMFPQVEPTMFLGMEMNMFALGTTLLSVVMVFYVLVGGMRTVAWSDVIQGVLLVGGMIVAGIATIAALGGVGGFFEAVSQLPKEAQSVPGPSGIWTPTKLFTVCLFASVASMIQPGQWMRYLAAKSSKTLRSSALIFAVVLTFCFLFGTMIVGLGGRALYPPVATASGLMPNPAVGSSGGEFDQVVIVMIQEQVPALLGAFGTILVAIILVAILAASMSTADSNLHSLSAVFTRDIYNRFFRPESSEKERAWVGRTVIVVVSALALWLVNVGQTDATFRPLELIAELMLIAIAFSAQLLPVTIDVLFLRKGTRKGAIAGMMAGLVVVLMFTPFREVIWGGDAIGSVTSPLSKLFDVGFIGLTINAIVFAIVSRFTDPVPAETRDSFARLMSGSPETSEDS